MTGRTVLFATISCFLVIARVCSQANSGLGSGTAAAELEKIQHRTEVPNLDGYEVVQLEAESYKYSKNDFRALVSRGYTIKIALRRSRFTAIGADSFDGQTTYIAEIIYYAEKGGDKLLMGRVSKILGFVDGNGKPVSASPSISIDSNFMKNQFEGFPNKTVEHPFFLVGIARDAKGNIRETDVLIMLKLNAQKVMLEEHKIEF
jgi:hypothetical protein